MKETLVRACLCMTIAVVGCGDGTETRPDLWQMEATATQVDDLSTIVDVALTSPNGSPVPNARVTVTAGVGAPLSIDGRTSLSIRTNGEGVVSIPVECLGSGDHYVEVETVAPGGVVFEFLPISCPSRAGLEVETEGSICRVELASASAVTGSFDQVGELNELRVWIAPELVERAGGAWLDAENQSTGIRSAGGEDSWQPGAVFSPVNASGYATFYVTAGLEGVYEFSATVLNVPCDEAEIVFLDPSCEFEVIATDTGPLVNYEVCFSDVGENDLSGQEVTVVATEAFTTLVLDSAGCARSWIATRDGAIVNVAARWSGLEVCHAEIGVPNRPTTIELNCPQSVVDGCTVKCDVLARGKDGVRVRWPESIEWDAEGEISANYSTADVTLRLSELVDRAPDEREIPTDVGHPSDALGTVMVSLGGGVEFLVDANSDGVLDGEDAFIDTPGPFLDANDDGIAQPDEERTGFRGTNGVRDTDVAVAALAQIAVFSEPTEGSAPGYPGGVLTHFRVGRNSVPIGGELTLDLSLDPSDYRDVTLFVFDENGTAPAGATATWSGCGLDRRRSGTFEPTVRIASERVEVAAQTYREETSTVFEPTGISTGLRIEESCTLSVEVRHGACGETWEFEVDLVMPEE